MVAERKVSGAKMQRREGVVVASVAAVVLAAAAVVSLRWKHHLR